MKNLTNGANNVVVVNGTDDSSSGSVGNPAGVTGGSGLATRMLLPHESVVLSPAGSATLIHQQTHHHHHHHQQQQPLIHQQTLTPVTTASFNSQFINHLQSNHHLAVSAGATPTTSFQSQFHNAYVDVNSIFRSAATTSSNSSAPSHHQHQHLPHLVSNASSLVYANGTTAASKHHLHHHHQQHHQHHQQQQTVPESQTANNNTSNNATSAVASNPERPGGATADGRGIENQTPATATEDDTTTAADDCKDQTALANATPAAAAADEEPEPEIDIVINNVVCSFSVRCHLNLRDIAQKGFNVEFRRENGMVTMKLRRPYTTASIWSSGKITCTGATSEDQAKVAARRYSRCLQKLGFNVRFRNFRIVNVLGTCSMPWGIMIVNFSERYKKDASYEPELHPGVTYKLYNPKATLKIFSTGSITVTAASVAFVQSAIEHIFPLVYEFRKKRTPAEKVALLKTPVEPVEDPFDPDLLIEEDCDITEGAPSTVSLVPEDGSDATTKAISRRSGRKCASRYSSSGRVGGRRRPAGKADNDPTEDAMFVSDDDDDEDEEDDDMIESD